MYCLARKHNQNKCIFYVIILIYLYLQPTSVYYSTIFCLGSLDSIIDACMIPQMVCRVTDSARKALLRLPAFVCSKCAWCRVRLNLPMKAIQLATNMLALGLALSRYLCLYVRSYLSLCLYSPAADKRTMEREHQTLKI